MFLTKRYLIPLWIMIGIVSVNFLSIRIYQYLCYPSGWHGWLLSFVSSPSPWCYSLLTFHVKMVEWYMTFISNFWIYLLGTLSGWFGAVQTVWK